MRRTWAGLPLWWWAVVLLVLWVPMDPMLTTILGVMALVRGVLAFVQDGARGLRWMRTRGLPTDAQLATAPNLRWHTPACAWESSSTFEVRLQCSISGADVQGADAIVTSTETNDSVDTFSYNKVGTHRMGEFMFRIRGINKSIAQVTRRVAWRVIYFDTQGQFGYVTDCWADVTFNGNAFVLVNTRLDLSGPKDRHKTYRSLPKSERQKYSAMFRTGS